MEDIQVTIIGSGNVGSALARRLLAAGRRVTVGVRDPAKRAGVQAALGGGAQVLDPVEAAAGAQIVFLAVPGPAAVAAARGLGDLQGKILIDCNNPLTWNQGPVWNPPPEGSLTAALAAALPGVRVLKALNTFGAEFHADPRLAHGEVADVFVAGDDAGARGTLAQVLERAGFRAIDAGPLRNAAVLENVAILWIHLATVGGRGREFALKALGRG